MPKLKEFEGREIRIIFVNPNRASGLQAEIVKLINVDEGGIWVENQALTNEVLEQMNQPMSTQVATFFYPFGAIHAIFVSVPGTSLSEKAFGV